MIPTKKTLQFVSKVKELLIRQHELFDSTTVIASIITFVFVMTMEISTNEPSIIITSGFYVHYVVWLLFTVYVLLFFDKDHPQNSLRKLLPEMLIVWTWYPLWGQQIQLGFVVLPYSALHLIGVTSHAWIIGRQVRRHWGDHQLFATIISAIGFLLFAAAVIREVEPQTFQNYGVAIWFVIETLSTVGYGDVSPQTFMGKVVTILIILGGIGLLSEFSGDFAVLVHRLVSNAKTDDSENLKLSQQVDRLEEKVDELKDLLTQVLHDVHKDRH